MRHMPEEREIAKLPKQWVINVASTVIGEPFDQWIKARIIERNDKLAEEKNLLISVDPEVAAAFRGSNAISRKLVYPRLYLFTKENNFIFHVLETNGTGVGLLKIGAKRRRTKQEVQEEHEEALIKEEAISQKVAQYEAMALRIQELEQQATSNQAAANILSEMLQKGEAVQDEEGRISILKDGQRESEFSQ